MPEAHDSSDGEHRSLPAKARATVGYFVAALGPKRRYYLIGSVYFVEKRGWSVCYTVYLFSFVWALRDKLSWERWVYR